MRTLSGGGWAAACLALLCSRLPAPAAEAEPFREAVPGYRYAFPRDHFEHPDFQTEWWYYTGNLALTDIDGRRFMDHQRLNRAGPGVAGSSFARRRVWNGNWSANWKGDEQVLEATAEEFHFRFRLQPAKPPVIHGAGGVSQKA